VPGKHAPESPASFFLSVGRAAAGALVVLGVVAVIAVAATGSNKKPTAKSSTPTVATTTHPPTISPSAVATSPTPTASASTAPKVTVNVLNGTTRARLASGLATKLTKEGYTVKNVGNNATHQATTTIYYLAGEKAAAEALLAAHPELGKIQAAIASTPTTAMLTVILGDDYKPA
jgi:hypothetical protein